VTLESIDIINASKAIACESVRRITIKQNHVHQVPFSS
jgi:hypothetical protein